MQISKFIGTECAGSSSAEKQHVDNRVQNTVQYSTKYRTKRDTILISLSDLTSHVLFIPANMFVGLALFWLSNLCVNDFFYSFKFSARFLMSNGNSDKIHTVIKLSPWCHLIRFTLLLLHVIDLISSL